MVLDGSSEDNVDSVRENALADLDWCLEQLEKQQTHMSPADMAATKFKTMLNRELSVLSKSSKEGQNISAHITSTYYGEVTYEIAPSLQ